MNKEIFDKYLPSKRFGIPTDEKRSFLKGFDVMDDLDNLIAISKETYRHTCPDHIEREFKYAIIGEGTEMTQDSVTIDDGEEVDADNVWLILIPTAKYVSEEMKRNIHEEYFKDEMSFQEFLKELDEYTLIRYSDNEYQNSPTFFNTLYPYISITQPEGSFKDEKGRDVYWPKAILDDIARCIPYLDSNFGTLMRKTVNSLGMTNWNLLEMNILEKDMQDFFKGNLEWPKANEGTQNKIVPKTLMKLELRLGTASRLLTVTGRLTPEDISESQVPDGYHMFHLTRDPDIYERPYTLEMKPTGLPYGTFIVRQPTAELIEVAIRTDEGKKVAGWKFID